MQDAKREEVPRVFHSRLTIYSENWPLALIGEKSTGRPAGRPERQAAISSVKLRSNAILQDF